ncbi:type II toxin-antitoxin system Phd/YefM family antitoxin [Candidatus Thiothrix anitrata]|uniref:Antitoxin n=1 Tax=Candidatus Thiothrix anitrata TaxID=2823902 RepID=A0ABX7X762_9GAMM|nr:type II toxin-antitoxin system Phd/YefM family antitoxin [Candidatus Thiothrix anitrata]QTR49859.1 type II toxin-antitoxin system Phd/YefM family antitoxin [Candidatus Thiothrix anitrata]
MQTWAVQDAKARFSEFLDACLAQGPQVVTRRGAETAVLVPVEVWRRLQAVAKPSLKDLLLSDAGRGELVLPERGQARRRQVQEVL